MSVGGAEGPTQITLQGKGVKKNQCCRRESYGGSGDFEKKTLILRKISPKGKKIARKFQKILSFFSVLIFCHFTNPSTSCSIPSFKQTWPLKDFLRHHTQFGATWVVHVIPNLPKIRPCLLFGWFLQEGVKFGPCQVLDFCYIKKPISALFSPTRPP